MRLPDVKLIRSVVLECFKLDRNKLMFTRSFIFDSIK